MQRKIWKCAAVVLMSTTIALSNVGLNILANTLSTQSVDFSGALIENKTLDGLKGNFGTEENGYLIHKVNGDNQNISNVKSKEFSLESNVTFKQGNNATFIFGAQKNENANDLGKFFGIELSRTDDNNDIKIKLFQNPLGIGLGDNVVGTTVVTSVTDKNAPINFKVAVDKNNVMEVYVNDVKANLIFDKDFKNYYVGGYFGFLTWNTEALFDDFNLKTVTQGAPNFNNTLSNLEGQQGQWTQTEQGLHSVGSGDNFALSNTRIIDFEYSANIKNHNEKGAGALVFRSEDNPKNGSYIMNIDYSNKIFKLFSFPSGGTIKEVPLSNIAPKDDGSYDLLVQAVGDTIRVYVNEIGIINVKNNQFTGGKLGLLTWDGSATYQDVNHNALSSLEDIDEPKLTDFKINTTGVTITPSFNSDVSIYGMDIKPGIQTVILDPSANGTMYVTKRDENGNIIKEKTLIEDTFTISADEFVEDFMNVDITVVTEEGFSDTVNFAVNRWLSNEELSKQEYRSQFHVTPQSNFMNDPNGMVYDSTDGYWHLYYQYSTKNNFYNQSWAHVRSKDLVTWEQQPLGMQIDDDGLIFSGSAVEDKENSSGLFSDNKEGESKLVSLYTYHNPKDGKQSQALAWSKDHGVTWIKEGIVIPSSDSISGNDFRDPKVFKIDGDDRWYMVTAGGAAQIHVSDDLINWTKSQSLKYSNGDQIYSECPMLYPAKVNGTGDTKWVYGGSAGFYVVGSMVKDASGVYKWSAESEKLDVDSNSNPWAGFGKYATMTFFEDGTGQNRQIGISWLQDFVGFEGRHYRGSQSLPQEYGLREINGKYVITANPVKEVEKLRDTNNILYEAKDREVNKDDKNILKGVSGLRYDLESEFAIGSAKEFGFKLRKGNGQEIIFKYDVKTEKMKLDVSNAGPHQNSGNYDFTLIPTTDNKVKLRLIVDQGAVEAFGNDGEANISTTAYMSNKNIGMEFFTDGTITIENMKIYDMKSMYSNKSGSETETTQLYLDAPEYVELNESFEVNANIYPNKESAGVNWQFDKGLEKVSSDETSIVLKASKAGTYKVNATSKDGNHTKSSEVRIAKPNFDTNADGWEIFNGNWAITDQGVIANNLGAEDTFFLSDAKVEKNKPFKIEGKIQIKEGQAAGIAFGIKDKTNPKAQWYCANIDTVTSGGIAKMFKNINGQVWDVSKLLSEIPTTRDTSSVYQLRIEYDGVAEFSYYLNDMLVGAYSDSNFEGGYVGIQTYKSNSVFSDLMVASAGTIIEVSGNVEDTKAVINSNETDLRNSISKTVRAKQDNGIFVDAEIDWDLTNVDTSIIDTYAIEGTLKNSVLKVYANIIIVANKTQLQTVVDKGNAIEMNLYTKNSVTPLLEALEEANVILSDDLATQDEVDVMVNTLNELISKLEKLEINVSNGEYVNTGDTSNTNDYLIMLGLSVLAGLVIFKKRKTKK